MSSLSKLIALLLCAFAGIALFTAYSTEGPVSTSENGDGDDPMLSQVIESVDLDKPFDFAGEKLPMQSFDVRERLERELLRNAYYHSNTILNLKRSGRFFPLIEAILVEESVPEDIKYLAVIESDLSNAVSPAGARGYWQFLKGTAQEYGLEVNSQVDERYHLERSTRAAAAMLKNYKEKFGSWTMAAAAYNTGASRLGREAETQRTNNYYELNMSDETNRYIFRIVAMKEIMRHPGNYGFNLKAGDLYPPLDDFREVEVSESIDNLGDFAREHGMSYRMLKVLNPWLISSSLSNSRGKTYRIKVLEKP